MNPDGSDQTNITNLDVENAHPNWSADCSKIAFDTTGFGGHQISVMNADGSDVTRLTISDGSANPDWGCSAESPVGGEIIPVDMTSLFVAGAMTNAFWMLPTLGGIAGAAFALFKINRKHD